MPLTVYTKPSKRVRSTTQLYSCVPGETPGFHNQLLPTMDNPLLHLRQFWKDFDEPFPTPGDGNITNTNPTPRLVTKISNPEVENQASAIKYDTGKTDWSLMPWEAVEEINKVLEFGANKYAAHNWTQGDGFRYTRVLNSLFRHLFSWSRGEDLDPESGLSHLSHAGCNILFLIYYNRYKERYKNDDRFKR